MPYSMERNYRHMSVATDVRMTFLHGRHSTNGMKGQWHIRASLASELYTAYWTPYG